MNLHNSHRYNFGSPILPSHPSNWELEYSTGLNLPFWRRLINYVNTWWSIYYWFNNFANKQQKIAEKHFGKDIPHIIDVAKNMSLILINQEPLLGYPRPEIPNVIYFSGLHIAKTPPPLPKVMRAIRANIKYQSLTCFRFEEGAVPRIFGELVLSEIETLNLSSFRNTFCPSYPASLRKNCIIFRMFEKRIIPYAFQYIENISNTLSFSSCACVCFFLEVEVADLGNV